MGRTITTTSRFPRGLVTDQSGVKGALLECTDAIPTAQGNGWRTRGGKRRGAVAVASGAGVRVHAAPGLQLTAYAGVAELAGDDTAPSLRVLVGGSSAPDFDATNRMPTGVRDHAGALLTIGARTNRLGGFYGNGVAFGRELLLPSGNRLPVRWAGANETAYVTGTVAGTAGSRTITGTGTTWTAAHVGMYLWINDATVDDRAFRVVRRVSNTVLEVDRPLPATVSGESYRLDNASWWSVKPGVFGDSTASLDNTAVAAITSRGYLNARWVAQHLARVFAACTVENDGGEYPHRVRWSAVEAEVDADGYWGGAELWHTNAYVDVAPGRGGSHILAIASFGSSLFVFKQGAVFALRGFVETDGRDVGATVDTVLEDDGLLAETCQPVVTPDGLYFAGLQGVYRIDAGGIRNITDESGVRTAYRALAGELGDSTVRLSVANRRLIVHTTDTRAAAIAATQPNALVLHMDRGVWTQQFTLGTTNVVAVGTGEASVCTAADLYPGYVIDWADDLAAMRAYDGTDTTAAVTMRLTTHPIPLRSVLNSRVRAVMVRGKLVDSDAVDPELGVQVVLGEEGLHTGPEATLTAQDFAETGQRTEGWARAGLRTGCPPVDSVRLRVVQSGRSTDARVYELGVEHVAVARTR